MAKDTTKTNTAATAKTSAKDRVAPIFASVRTDIPLPTRSSNRGSKTLYPFETLAVGGSFGVTNKTAKQLSSIVSNQNRKLTEKRDANGNVVYKMQEIKDQSGAVINSIPTNEPEMVRGKNFFVVDTDPKQDPDKATARVFRDK